MKYLKCYQDLFGCECEEDVFKCILDNLKPSNNLWSYFVNWDKVYENVRKIEINLNLLNYLIGKENFDEEFKTLIKEQPQVIKILPALVVSREKQFNILIDYKNKKLTYENYDFSIKNPTEKDIEKYLHFVQESGLKDLICCGKIKSLVDYMIGVEAGLDSNGRKTAAGIQWKRLQKYSSKIFVIKKVISILKKQMLKELKKNLALRFPLINHQDDMIMLLRQIKSWLYLKLIFMAAAGQN